MKEATQEETSFSRFENQVSSAIMLMIVLVSMAIFAIVAWQVAKFVLR